MLKLKNDVLLSGNYLASLFPASAITLCLFLLMHALVYMKDVRIEDKPPFVFPDIHFELPPPTVEPTPPPELKKVSEPPAKPAPTEGTLTLPPDNRPVSVYQPTKSAVNVGFGSAMPIARLQVTAKYPRAALSRGIEGYVDIIFDVNNLGITENLRVIRSSPEGIFEKHALEAVAQWRYQPRVVDGEAMPFLGLTKRITFEIND